MDKGQAQKEANRLKAIENGLETLIDLARKVEGSSSLVHSLFGAKVEAKIIRECVEINFNVQASVVLPFKPRGKKK